MSLFLMRPTTENAKLLTRENFGPTKHPLEKILNPRNTHDKKFRTHEIPTRKILDP